MKTLSSRVVAKNRWVKILEDEFEIGPIQKGHYLVVEREAALMVIPIIREGNKYYTYLVRQFRYPIGKEVWQFPIGTSEKNSNAEEHAKQELQEETGLIAKRIKYITKYYVDPGLSRQVCKIYIAEDIIEGGTQQLEETERGMIAKKVPINDLDKMVSNGQLNDGWGYSGLYVLKNYIKQK